MRIKVEKVKDSPFQKKLQSLKNMNSQSVEVGHFASQGIHEGSGETYVDLMKFHHVGGINENGHQVPARPVLAYLKTTYLEDGVLSPKVKAAFKSWSRGEIDNEGFFSAIGLSVKVVEQRLFGAGGPLTPNKESTVLAKGRNDPLIDEGDLVSAVSYKTSISGVVK